MRSASAVGGAAALGGFGSQSVSAAEVASPTSDELDAALAADQSRQLLAEAGEPAVDRGSGKRVSATFGGRDLTVVTVQTEVGKLVRGETADGITETYLFLGRDASPIEGGRLSGLRSLLGLESSGGDSTVSASTAAALPDGLSVPTGSEAMLLTTDATDPMLFRRPTDAERAALADATGIDVANMRAWTYSEADAFHVVDATGVGGRDARVVQVDGELATSEVAAGDIRDATVTLPSMQSPGCFTLCYACLQGTGTCAGCVLACASVATGVGIIACGVCIAATCSSGGYACGACLDQCA